MLDKALDKVYESKSLDEILEAPVAALAGRPQRLNLGRAGRLPGGGRPVRLSPGW